MPDLSDINELLLRFVDDRDGLQEHEYAQLAEAVRQSPELAQQLRDQLIIDDVLSQRLAIDRRHFDAQVQQRIADHLRGEDELNQQADELRSLALARLKVAPAESTFNWSSVIAWGSALVLLLAIGVSIWSWQYSQHAALVATVAEVTGDVLVKRFPNASDQPAEVGDILQANDGLIVSDDASIALTWNDGTRVQLGAGTAISLPTTTAGKRISVDVGDLMASVAAQPPGRPMVFTTPHADAIVRGTELYLHVEPHDTHLKVMEGKVDLIEHDTHDSQLVQSSQEATASAGKKVAKSEIRWPTTQQGLVYLFSASRPNSLLRAGSLWRSTHFEPGGGAAVNSQGELELSGGTFTDVVGGAAVAAQVRFRRGMSLETVLAPAAPEGDQPRTILAFLDGKQGDWSLIQSGDRLHLAAAGEAPVPLATLPEFDKLTHLAITYQGDQLRHQLTVYLDGKYVRDVSLEGWLPTDGSRLVIGSAGPESSWHGRIAGIAIYDRKLTEKEISENFAGLTRQ